MLQSHSVDACIDVPGNLLQVQPLLQHARWETRAAAGECIGLMAEQAQHPTASQLQKVAAGGELGLITHPQPHTIQFLHSYMEKRDVFMTIVISSAFQRSVHLLLQGPCHAVCSQSHLKSKRFMRPMAPLQVESCKSHVPLCDSGGLFHGVCFAIIMCYNRPRLMHLALQVPHWTHSIRSSWKRALTVI